MPLYQRCVHLGCRVPFCQSSQWFECPCHGSKYNEAGEYQLGPAPHGMDRFAVKVEGGNVMVDTSTDRSWDRRAATEHDPPAPAGSVLRRAGLGEEPTRTCWRSAIPRGWSSRRPGCAGRRRGRRRSRLAQPRHPRAGTGHPARHAARSLRPRARDAAPAEAPGVGRGARRVLRALASLQLADRAVDEPRAGEGAEAPRRSSAAGDRRAVQRGEPARRGLRAVPRPGAPRRRDPRRDRTTAYPPNLTTICGGPSTGHAAHQVAHRHLHHDRARAGTSCPPGASGTRARSTTSRSTTS